jgi:RNA-directed DNA polymerase
MDKTKPYEISKQVVWEAFKRVKANKGAAGIDEESITDFEERLKDNLYKIWNRMSSGSYFPPPVKAEEIPKKSGGKRILGIPTVGDRVAQMVAKMHFEPIVEPHFHPDSYAYRPGKSPIDAVAVTRQRCWEYDWLIEFDIKGLFDNIDHGLLMRAVKRHTDCKWLLLYIERWLKAPFQKEDGQLLERKTGTPQGGVISPVLANLFLHYVFDKWMARKRPQNPFARYADDGVIHCRSKEEAEELLEQISTRFNECELELHPDKTHIVYCKDDKRSGSFEKELFDFLGYTFQPRRVWSKRGPTFIGFNPAVSTKAKKTMRQEMRRWRLRYWTSRDLTYMAQSLNPIIRGWIQYYGKFYRSALRSVFQHLNNRVVDWVMKKYKRFRGHRRRATYWLGRVAKRDPHLFAHWSILGVIPAAG